MIYLIGFFCVCMLGMYAGWVFIQNPITTGDASKSLIELQTKMHAKFDLKYSGTFENWGYIRRFLFPLTMFVFYVIVSTLTYQNTPNTKMVYYAFFLFANFSLAMMLAVTVKSFINWKTIGALWWKKILLLLLCFSYIAWESFIIFNKGTPLTYLRIIFQARAFVCILAIWLIIVGKFAQIFSIVKLSSLMDEPASQTKQWVSLIKYTRIFSGSLFRVLVIILLILNTRFMIGPLEFLTFHFGNPLAITPLFANG